MRRVRNGPRVVTPSAVTSMTSDASCTSQPAANIHIAPIDASAKSAAPYGSRRSSRRITSHVTSPRQANAMATAIRTAERSGGTRNSSGGDSVPVSADASTARDRIAQSRSTSSRPRVEVLVEVEPEDARVAEERDGEEHEQRGRDRADRGVAPAEGESDHHHGRRGGDGHRVAEVHRAEEVAGLALERDAADRARPVRAHDAAEHGTLAAARTALAEQRRDAHGAEAPELVSARPATV